MAIPYLSHTHWPATDAGFVDAPLPRLTCKKYIYTVNCRIQSRTLTFWLQNATIWSQSGALDMVISGPQHRVKVILGGHFYIGYDEPTIEMG